MSLQMVNLFNASGNNIWQDHTYLLCSFIIAQSGISMCSSKEIFIQKFAFVSSAISRKLQLQTFTDTGGRVDVYPQFIFRIKTFTPPWYRHRWQFKTSEFGGLIVLAARSESGPAGSCVWVHAKYDPWITYIQEEMFSHDFYVQPNDGEWNELRIFAWFPIGLVEVERRWTKMWSK